MVRRRPALQQQSSTFAIHLWSRGFAASDGVVILVSAGLGLVCESTLIRTGFIKYATGEFASGFAPAWNEPSKHAAKN